MKTFYYDKRVIFAKYGTLLVLLALFFCGFIYVVGLPANYGSNNSAIYNISLLIFMSIPLLSILLWMLNTLVTRIYVDSAGLRYKSLLRDISCEWCKVSGVEKKYYHSGGSLYETNHKDIKITAVGVSPIKVLYFLKKQDDGSNVSAIDELQTIIEEMAHHLKCKQQV